MSTAGPDRRRSLTQCVESALVDLFAQVGGPPRGLALACVGSLARRELGPRSDVDLVLLHQGLDRGVVTDLADKLWYPLWDSGVKLDHSVRTPTECAQVASAELSAGVGLLDLRVVAGDASLVSAARTALLHAWRTNARQRLPELLGSLDERRAAAGDAAYLLEPDLKEGRGGFRDMTMLRALAATWLTDRPHAAVEGPYERLLDVRDALHVTSGRSLDRLVAGEAAEVASLLGYSDTDALHREVSLAARRIGHAVDLTVRAARQAVPQRRMLSFARRERRPVYTRADHGLIIHAGEVGLDRDTDPGTPLLALHAGALAAREGLMLSPVTAGNLGAHTPPLPQPWSDEARDAFVTMLATGDNLVPVWEALDLAGVVTRWIPEWNLISAHPQHNPIHRHTVDRHSVQTVAEAQRHLTQVERPDLLLLACLLHDIGKGQGGGAQHPAVGAPTARRIAEYVGLGAADADLIELLVREHLTLASLATRRDHTDPATLDALVAAVDGRTEVLNLLRRLTEADARAAGPAAWSPWRAQLINALADQAEGLLVGEERDDTATDLVDLGLARSVRLDGTPRLRMEQKPGGLQLVIATRDRLGLFSETAGLLASNAISVRSAVLHTVEGVAVNTWRIDKQRPIDLPDPAFLVKQLQRLEAGDTSMLEPVRRREARVTQGRLTGGRLGEGPDTESRVSEGRAREPYAAGTPYVALIPSASQTAAVIEIRTADRPGLLFALGRQLTGEQISIRSAHIATLAGQAIDTFYLTEADGSCPSPERARRAVEVLAAGAAT